MNTAIEERLADALAARADQVRPEELQPLADPAARRAGGAHCWSGWPLRP